MVQILQSILIISLLLLALSPVAFAECPDPLESILATLECITEEDATCASAGYHSDRFRKLHNGVDTNTTIDGGGAFWTAAFSFVDLHLDYDHQLNVGPNQASIRYIETVTMTDGSAFGLPPSTEYPFGQVYWQHEHALVTVDDECKMILWDQYGDNEEQRVVDEATNAILCAIGMMPAEACPETAAESTTTTTTELSEMTNLESSAAGSAWKTSTYSSAFAVLTVFLLGNTVAN